MGRFVPWHFGKCLPPVSGVVGGGENGSRGKRLKESMPQYSMINHDRILYNNTEREREIETNRERNKESGTD